MPIPHRDLPEIGLMAKAKQGRFQLHLPPRIRVPVKTLRTQIRNMPIHKTQSEQGTCREHLKGAVPQVDEMPLGIPAAVPPEIEDQEQEK